VLIARRAWVEGLVRELLSNTGFTVSVLIAVAITLGFAFIFEITSEIVMTLLMLGVVTAIVHYVWSLERPS
jgi:hypothetical protein